MPMHPALAGNSAATLRRIIFNLLFLCLLNLAHSQSPTISVLHYFTNYSDGGQPLAGVILVSNTLYGTTFQGGTNGNGITYALNTDGSDYRVLYQFSALASVQGSGEHPTNFDGASPRGGLRCLGHTLFGTTSQGGLKENGTFFSINLDGSSFANRYNFVGPTQSWQSLDSPSGDLLPDGSTFYGTAVVGYDSLGGVYALGTNGDYNSIYSFSDRLANGDGPTGGLALLGDTLYGMTVLGGRQGLGNIFAVNTNGSSFAQVFSFPSYAWDGAIFAYTNYSGYSPVGQLAAVGNKLIGMTQYGGTGGSGTVFSINPDGTGLTVLHAFTATGAGNTNIDGANPLTDLIAGGALLYGSTPAGGVNGSGVIFSLKPDGSQFTVLHHMNGPVDGYAPNKLLLSGNHVYGTTRGGGLYSYGTVFSLPVVPPPVVISGALISGAGTFTMDFSGAPNSTNLVQVTTNLTIPGWQTISTNIADGTGHWRWTNSDAYRQSQQFYQSVTPSN